MFTGGLPGKKPGEYDSLKYMQYGPRVGFAWDDIGFRKQIAFQIFRGRIERSNQRGVLGRGGNLDEGLRQRQRQFVG